jgi:hypothetical protein
VIVVRYAVLSSLHVFIEITKSFFSSYLGVVAPLPLICLEVWVRCVNAS